MKKKLLYSKNKVPADLLVALEKQRKLAAEQELSGNFDTYDHTKLARLETAVAEYQNQESEVE